MTMTAMGVLTVVCIDFQGYFLRSRSIEINEFDEKTMQTVQPPVLNPANVDFYCVQVTHVVETFHDQVPKESARVTAQFSVQTQ